MSSIKDEIKKICDESGAKFLKDEILSKHTTMGVGGACKGLIKINSAQHLKKILSCLNASSEKFFILGKGSNVLVSDKGYEGYIVNIDEDFADISYDGKKTLTVCAGASMRKTGNFAHSYSLTGFEALSGIPGSIGGAVYMNAGAYGSEICDVIESVTSIDSKGNIITRKKDEISFSYRHSSYCDNGEVVISADIVLEEGSPEEIKAAMEDYAARRKEKQPLEYKSAGSTFKRPAGSFASLLIDECGLKGRSVGGAEVSTKHAGFVVNKGSATCTDILELCREVHDIVLKEKGFDLELEPIVLD
jgi:UDP-N-acetylmuramate dehydrogenase